MPVAPEARLAPLPYFWAYHPLGAWKKHHQESSEEAPVQPEPPEQSPLRILVDNLIPNQFVVPRADRY